MKKITTTTVCLFIFILLIGSVTKASDPLKPLRTDHPPTIDGILNDLVWQNAPSITGFKTFTPDFGHDMAEKTIAYMAYDQENMYFAFRCYDSQPDKIKSSVTRRDNIRADDWICINLDSFNDQQGLYGFYINPFGIQEDTRFAGGTEDKGIDLVWYSKGQIDAEGYTIEVQIPFKSIRFANKEIVEMGVIFERKISRRSEQGTYPPLSPDIGLLGFLTQMQPMIYQDIKHYTLFEVLPAVTYGQRSEIDQGSLSSLGSNEDFSLTGKLGLTSDLILDGTYNPDFSQVEADAGQVDFNQRFALFFSEKRPFFLEGRENFNFSGSSHGDPLISVVHTRTIVNPITGIKLSGKTGKKNTIASIYALDELPGDDPDGDYAHFAIMRYKRTLSSDSYIGGVYTGREVENGHNRVFGADGSQRINQSSVLGYHLLFSNHKDSESLNNEDGHALGVNYVYQTRKLRLGFGYHDIGDRFQTETGFITRTGIAKFRASFRPRFYPETKLIRRVDPSIFSSQTKDKLSDLWETYNSASLSFVLHGNGRVSTSYVHSTEIFLGKKFDTNRWSVSGSRQFNKQLTMSLSYSNGKAIRYIEDPFQAKRSNASASIIFQPSDKINANVRLTYTDLFQDSNLEKIFDITILRNRLTYQMNQYLFFRGIVEYNSFRKSLLTDFLASFTYIPGTVMHFGYGSFYEKLKFERGEYLESNRYLETTRGFFAKASYLWRL